MTGYAGTSSYAAARPVLEACGRRRRFFAALLDSAILGFVGLIIGSAILAAMVDSPRWLFSEQPDGTITLRDEVEAASLVIMVAMIAITAFYYVGFHLMTGQTPGKRMLGIKVVDIHSGEAPNLGTSVLRYIIYAGPWFAGYAMGFAGPPLESFAFTMDIATLAIVGWILFEKTRRGLHDIIAETAVVRTRPPERDLREAPPVSSGW